MAPDERRLLVRNFRALLDQRLDLVGGQHARAGDDLALAVGFQRRELEVEERASALSLNRMNESWPALNEFRPAAGRFDSAGRRPLMTGVPLASARRPGRC